VGGRVAGDLVALGVFVLFFSGLGPGDVMGWVAFRLGARGVTTEV
jgi:hypothetical protein